MNVSSLDGGWELKPLVGLKVASVEHEQYRIRSRSRTAARSRPTGTRSSTAPWTWSWTSGPQSREDHRAHEESELVPGKVINGMGEKTKVEHG